MKTFYHLIPFIALGCLVIIFWGVGSHGNIMFRPHVTEDWVLAILLLISWGIPVFVILHSLYCKMVYRNKSKRNSH